MIYTVVLNFTKPPNTWIVSYSTANPLYENWDIIKGSLGFEYYHTHTNADTHIHTHTHKHTHKHTHTHKKSLKIRRRKNKKI